MKKLLIFLILALGINLSAIARGLKEAAYLKYESTFRGLSLESTPNTGVNAQNADGSNLTYRTSKIERVANEERQNASSDTTVSSFRSRRIDSGFKFFVESAYAAGTDDEPFSRWEIGGSAGYQLSPRFYLGAGANLIYLNSQKQVGLPVFVDFRVNVLNRAISPIAGIKTGWSFIGDLNGFYLNPYTGCRFGLNNKLALHVAVGYELQRASITYNDYTSPFIQTKYASLEAFKVQFGVEF